jgi:hypothetical protein
MLDDIFVLWRAFESSIRDDSTDNHSRRSRQAVAETLRSVATREFHTLQRLIDSLTLLADGTDADLRAWFPDDRRSVLAVRNDIESRVDLIGQAFSQARWRPGAAQSLAALVYELRCAIFHASLETTHRITQKLTPALRDFMTEFLIVHAARLSGLSPHQAREKFDADLAKLQA